MNLNIMVTKWHNLHDTLYSEERCDKNQRDGYSQVTPFKKSSQKLYLESSTFQWPEMFLSPISEAVGEDKCFSCAMIFSNK